MLKKIDPALFDQMIGGKKTSLHLLQNSKGMQVAITNYGARIVALLVPGKNNTTTDVVLGFDSLEGYLTAKEKFHGAIVGRYANRIARGHFWLNGKDYHLPVNLPPNHLHGGPNGFHTKIWTVENADTNSIRLSCFSADGDEGYPGNLTLRVTYTVSEDNELTIQYNASCDAPTIVNFTAHPYFNLNGQGSGTIINHTLQIDADYYSPVDDTLIPLGIAPVENTPFDFRKPKKIGRDIDQQNEQLDLGAGYDHNFVLEGAGSRKVATAVGDQTSIAMDVITDQPGMQLYTSNHLKGENAIKYGFTDKYREAFCLETQHFPDSPNHPQFPSTVLTPGENFESKTVYKFHIAY